MLYWLYAHVVGSCMQKEVLSDTMEGDHQSGMLIEGM